MDLRGCSLCVAKPRDAVVIDATMSDVATSDVRRWIRFAESLLRVAGVESAGHARLLAEQFSRMPRSRVGGVELHHSSSGAICDVEAVVGSAELPRRDSVESHGRRLDRPAFVTYLRRRLCGRAVELPDDSLGDIWIEGSNSAHRDGAVLIRRRTGSTDEEWAALAGMFFDESHRQSSFLESARVARMVGVMPGRGSELSAALRLLYADIQEEQFAMLLSLVKPSAEIVATYQQLFGQWKARDGLANVALNVSGPACVVSGLELYPRDIHRLESWARLADTVGELTGWTSDRVPRLANWAQVWSGPAFSENAPSHLVGASVLCGDEVSEPELRVSPSHVKLTLDAQQRWRLKSYLRYECSRMAAAGRDGEAKD